MIDIEYQNSFENALKTGINIFAGSGFSVLAKDKNGKNLPVGSELCSELCAIFNKPNLKNLAQVSTILERQNKEDFYNYLIERFTVSEVDALYYNLNKINVHSYFTTNIDNLIPKIIEKHSSKSIHNQAIDGATQDDNVITFLPLHGNITVTPHTFIFDTASLANVHYTTPHIWKYLSVQLECCPTLFVGYSMNDYSVIQTLTSEQTFQHARKDIWVMVHPNDKDNIEYYNALGFHIITSDIASFLSYLTKFQQKDLPKRNRKDEVVSLLKANIVPRNINEVNLQRSILEFYGGSTPLWCDVLSNQLYKTHYVAQIKNCIYGKKHAVIVGAPVSGKTTLLMQVAIDLGDDKIKLFFDNITKSRAEYVTKLLTDIEATIFIDNLSDNIDAILHFENYKNIKLVCAERSHYFGIISHLLDEEKYQIINVTSLSDFDLQGIYNGLPERIKKETMQKESELKLYGKDSIFEFVIRNVNQQNIQERYSNVIRELETNDTELAEFLALCAYMHNCRIPLSYEMAYSYFDYMNYKDIFAISEDAMDIIKEYIPTETDNLADMDYYYPRSYYIAETILKSISSTLLQTVLNKVIRNIPPMVICNYNTFRRYAFDKVMVSRAFDENSWQDGVKFYEQAYLYDGKNPYVLQQGALYLAQMRQYDLAFNWIDKAISMTDNKYFSIRNSHAIILFNANIEKNGTGIREQLDKSMAILEKCMNADKRKRFHAITYGQQAIKYHYKYHDKKSHAYLQQALQWLDTEIKRSAWDNDVLKVKDNVTKALGGNIE